jgi:hypothetical protein
VEGAGEDEVGVAGEGAGVDSETTAETSWSGRGVGRGGREGGEEGGRRQGACLSSSESAEAVRWEDTLQGKSAIEMEVKD